MNYRNISLIGIVILFSLLGVTLHYLYGYSWISTSGHAYGSDDAFITYRYAKNLYDGLGLVFNSGERVEGYSNFLYAIIIYVGYFFTEMDAVLEYSVIVNAVFFVISILIFYLIMRKHVTKKMSLFGVVLFGVNPAVWANVNTGLETILVQFVFLWIWLLIESPRTAVNISLVFLASAVSMLTRVDGFILPVIVSLYFLFHGDKKLSFSLIGFVAIFMAGYALVRLGYYGDVIANTYYAKVSGAMTSHIVSGLEYLFRNSIYNGIAAVYVAALLIHLFRSGISWHPTKASFPLVYSFIWCAYLIYIGGDIYYERFLLPVFICGVFLFVKALDEQGCRQANVTMLIVFSLSFLVFKYDGRFFYANKNYDMWVALGEKLSKLPPDELVAIDAAGKVPYYSNLRVLDMLGLNNRHIGKMPVSAHSFYAGHNKYDAKYTLSKKPDIISAWISPDLNMAWGLSKELYSKNYKLCTLVYSGRDLRPNYIINVAGADLDLVKYLIRNNYNYALLQRTDSNISTCLGDSIDEYISLHTLVLGKKYLFNDNTGQIHFFKGWSSPEAKFRWSNADSSNILFYLKDTSKPKGEISINARYLEEQRINLWLNGEKIYKTQSADVGKVINIQFKPELLTGGRNILTFEFPDAHVPNNGDRRILAMAIKNITIE